MADFQPPLYSKRSSSALSKKSLISNGSNGYEDVFGGPPKFSVPTFAPRIEDYGEIFGCFGPASKKSSASMIPYLDFPGEDEATFEVSSGSKSFDYGQVFGGLDGVDFAVSYEEMLLESKRKEMAPENLRMPDGVESQLQASPTDSRLPSEEHYVDAFCHLEQNECLSNGDLNHVYDGVKQFNVSYLKSNQRSHDEDSVNRTMHVADLHEVSGFADVVDAYPPPQKTSCDKPKPPIADDLCPDEYSHGEMMEGNHFKETSSTVPVIGNMTKVSGNDHREEKQQFKSKSSTSGGDPESDSHISHDSCDNLKLSDDRSYPQKAFLTISDISLQTQPSQDPPPSRPPPRLAIRQGDSNKIMDGNLRSHLVEEHFWKPSTVHGTFSSRSASETSALEEAAKDSSSCFFDVEVDVSSAAAASAAAMKEAMEKAQARLKSAKQSMERKKFQNLLKPGLDDSRKGKETREAPAALENHKCTEERTGEWKAEKQFFEFVKDDMVKCSQGVPLQETNKKLNATGKVHEREYEKKVAKEMSGLAKKDKPTATKEATLVEENGRASKGSKEAQDGKENEKKLKAAAGDAHQQEEHDEKRLKKVEVEEKLKAAAAEIFENENNKKKLKAVLEAREQEENEKNLRATQEACEREENEKKLMVAHEWEENEKRLKAAREACEWLKESSEREENERRLKAAQEAWQWEENERRLKPAQEAHEQEENQRRLKATREACEQEENEKRLKAAQKAWQQEENERRLKAAQEAREQEEHKKRLKAAQEAHEREEHEKRLKAAQEARDREEHEKWLKAAQEAREREENEKRLKAAQEAREREENEKRLKAAQEAREREENEKRLKAAQEARKWEENKRRLKAAQEAREREENEKRLKAAQEAREREENEKKLKAAQVAREWEENEKRLKAAQEAREREETEKRLKAAQEAREREENEKRLKAAQEAHAREESERRLKAAQEAREREESERRLKAAQEAREREENERRLKAAQEAREHEENEKRLKAVQEAREREENKKRLKAAQEAREREENKRLKAAQEAREQEENEKRLKAAQEARKWEENERLKAAQEAREREEDERRLKAADEVAHEWEENERHMKRVEEGYGHEENEKRIKEVQVAHENEGNDKRLKTAHVAKEHEETEIRLKASQMAQEHEENERKLEAAQEAPEWEENQVSSMATEEAHDQEEILKSQKTAEKAHECEENERKLKGACELSENKLKAPPEVFGWEEHGKKVKAMQRAHECEGNSEKVMSSPDYPEWEEMEKLKIAHEGHELEQNEKKLKAALADQEEENEKKVGGDCESVLKEELKSTPDGFHYKGKEKSLKAVQEAHEREEVRVKAAQEFLHCEEEMGWKAVKATNQQEKNRKELKINGKASEQGINDQDEESKQLKTMKDTSGDEQHSKGVKAGEAVCLQGGEMKLEACHMLSEQDEKMKSRAQVHDGEHRKELKSAHEPYGGEENGKNHATESEEAHYQQGDRNRMKAAQQEKLLEEKEDMPRTVSVGIENKFTTRKEQSANEIHETEGKAKEERKRRELEMERVRRLEGERDREREREKDRILVERATREARDRAFSEARERAERAAVERATAEARQRAFVEAREKAEKASVGAREKLLAEKAAVEARLKAERAAVERATAEARERAIEKALAEKAAFGAKREDKYSGPESSSSTSQRYPNSLNQASYANGKHQGTEVESAKRCQARLERHQRTVKRAAKALAEKNLRDILAQREQAERNRLSETLDAEVKRWSSGKEGNLRALLSTLQYILGPDSGWQPIPLTDVITAAAVKKAYRKATLCVHPDKVQQRGASIQQKYICEKVFDLLKEAWNKFNSEER